VDTTAELPIDINNNAIPVLRPSGTTTTSPIVVASGAAHAESAAVGTAGLYLISVSEDCYIDIGSSPVATSSKMFRGGGSDLFVRLLATDKISALQRLTAGSVCATLML
jgi:hypothetical protein